jgi:hypothetical protein
MVAVPTNPTALFQDLVATAKDAVNGTRPVKQLGGRNNLAPGTSREGLADNLGIEMVGAVDFKVRGRWQSYGPQLGKPNRDS